MTYKETMKQALDALEYWDVQGKLHQPTEEAITAIKEALAQPEQEPVAYINVEERKLEWAYKYMSWDTPTIINLPKIPLYTTPPQRTEQNFCSRCGKRTPDLITIHTCTPPKENNT